MWSYNASNNELVRTQTLVRIAIIQVDAASFRQWYERHYGQDIGRKKKAAINQDIEVGYVHIFTRNCGVCQLSQFHHCLMMIVDLGSK